MLNRLKYLGKGVMMSTLKFSLASFLCICLIVISGCVSEQQYKELRVQNNTQRKRISEIESELKATKLKLDRLQRKLDSAEKLSGVETDALQQKIAALQEDLAKKKNLIAIMQKQLLYGGARLPVELSTKLEDFAKDKELVTFDSEHGIVKFKSDLLFEPGSDEVTPSSIEAVKSLCSILNLKEANKFDIIVAGHTDNIPIAKPATRQKHPTNWHLSADRAISVLKVMENNRVNPERLSVRGFSKYRPVAPNKPNNKGNPENRRVEIYIVPKGM